MIPVEDLLAKATEIKNETVENNNSANRVGTWMEEVIPHLDQIADKADHGYIGTPKTLKNVEDEKTNEIAQLAGDLNIVASEILDEEFIKVIVDNEGKVVEGILSDGKKYLSNPTNQDDIQNEKISSFNTEVSEEYLKTITDKDGKLISWIDNKGQFGWSSGIPPFLKSYISSSAKVSNKTIRIAASDSTVDDKNSSDYVCDGIDDAEIIQSSITRLISIGGGKILLRTGRYYLNTIKSNNHILDINLSNSPVTIEIEGDVLNVNEPTYPGQDRNTGAQLYVTDDLYDSLNNSDTYTVINCENNKNYNGAIIFKNFGIIIPSNQKKIIAIDQFGLLAAVKHHSLYINCYNHVKHPTVGIGDAPPVAVDGSIGIRTMPGVGLGVLGTEYINCIIKGFYEGFAINGEHNFLALCATVFCSYGYTFNRYDEVGGHPNMLFRCQDERSINLPRWFNTTKKQSTYIIALNIERVSGSAVPGGVLGDEAMEYLPGLNTGTLSFTAGQREDIKFWANGHGRNIKTTNMAHNQFYTTSQRNAIVPNFLQRVFDTTLQKEAICIDEGNNIWVDAIGNII